MARDVNRRIQQLRTRRGGIDRITKMSMDAQLQARADSVVEEGWQKRAAYHPNTRYALGAMQEVSPDYTRISIETATRVGRQIDVALAGAGFSLEFRLQGSVPLNVHIRGVSDVDLLSLDASFLTYARAGKRSQFGYYTSPTSRTSLEVLSDMRSAIERALKDKYPAAAVDVSGGKAVNISGGSLARPVDVVPLIGTIQSNTRLRARSMTAALPFLTRRYPRRSRTTLSFTSSGLTIDVMPF